MLSSTDDANSVGDRSPLGGVSIWPGAVVAGGVLVSPPLGAWAVAQGGVSTCPGSSGPQADAFVSTTRADKQSNDVKTTKVPSALRVFMFSPLGLVTDSILETKQTKDASEERTSLRQYEGCALGL